MSTGRKGMAACDAFASQPETFAKAVLFQRFEGVIGAAGVMAAAGSQQRAQQELVGADQRAQTVMRQALHCCAHVSWHGYLPLSRGRWGCWSVGAGFAELVQQTADRGRDGWIVEIADARPCQQNEVDCSKVLSVQTEGFTAQSLDAVALDRAAGIFLGNDEPQARGRLFAGTGEQQHMFGRETPGWLVEDAFVVCRCEYALVSAKTVFHGQPGAEVSGAEKQDPSMMDPADQVLCRRSGRKGQNKSGAETGAAFGATTGQNLATFLGGHAGAETVGTCALQVGRLECTFHGDSWNLSGGSVCLAGTRRSQEKRARIL